MCFYAERKNQTELSLKELEDISKKMRSFPYLLITGGEPFLRKDLPQICELFYRNNRVQHITIPTNAILTQEIEEQAKKILEKCPDAILAINLSLNGVGAGHEIINGIEGSFNAFSRSYDRLLQLKQANPNLFLNIMFTFTRYNEDTLKEVYEYAVKKFRPNDFGVILVRGKPREMKAKEIAIEKYKEGTRNIDITMFKDHAVGKYNNIFSQIMASRTSLMHKLNALTVQGKKSYLPCFAGKLNAVITEAGDVYPCELLNRKFGNLRDCDYDFQKIWRSTFARETRRWIKKTKCTCTHECYVPLSILYSTRGFISLLKEWSTLRSL